MRYDYTLCLRTILVELAFVVFFATTLLAGEVKLPADVRDQAFSSSSFAKPIEPLAKLISRGLQRTLF